MWLRGTLYTRIAALFLLLLTAFCVVAVGFTVREFGAFLEELEQRLNTEIAAHLVAELGPEIALDPNADATVAAVRRIHDINPALDIYVIDRDGRIVATYANDPRLLRSQVDLTPVRTFLSDDPMMPVRAADPASADGEKVFSAAPLVLPGGERGFLFIILRGKSLEMAASMLRNSYIVRSVAFALGAALLVVALAGFLLFALLTRRFRRLTDTVQRFRDGDYEHRVAVHGGDEIGRLGAAFNEMAATIQAQVEALRRTDNERRVLVANVSHDFRTPLTSLRGYAERLKNAGEHLARDDRDACLDAVLGNTEQLEHLAQQLASLSQLDSNGDTTQMETFSLSELVQDVTLKFQPLAEEKGVALRAQLRSQPNVRGDISLVERVLANLIDNAIRCTPSGGDVHVDTEIRQDEVQVAIRDTGIGIDADELALVRQRFYRTRSSRQAHPSGSGLGLAIACEILELHGSRLDLQSVPGSGTTAIFTLGIADD